MKIKAFYEKYILDKTGKQIAKIMEEYSKKLIILESHNFYFIEKDKYNSGKEADHYLICVQRRKFEWRYRIQIGHSQFKVSAEEGLLFGYKSLVESEYVLIENLDLLRSLLDCIVEEKIYLMDALWNDNHG